MKMYICKVLILLQDTKSFCFSTPSSPDSSDGTTSLVLKRIPQVPNGPAHSFAHSRYGPSANLIQSCHGLSETA